MKLIPKLVCAAVATMSFAGAAQADTVLTDWVFNPNGSGFATGVQVNEFLNITGNGFIQLSNKTATTFSFVEHAVFKVRDPDNTGNDIADTFGGGELTAVFSATGTGTFGGKFTFGSGTIKMYRDLGKDYGQTSASTSLIYGANNGNLLATFDVLADPRGGGTVDGTGSPTGNGQVSVYAQATSLAPNSFFRADGTELKPQDTLAFAFTGANGVSNPNANLVQELICQYSGFSGPGCGSGTYANSPGNYLLVANNGTFKLAEAPEPGSLALFGIAMLGAGVVSRKRANKA